MADVLIEKYIAKQSLKEEDLKTFVTQLNITYRNTVASFSQAKQITRIIFKCFIQSIQRVKGIAIQNFYGGKEIQDLVRLLVKHTEGSHAALKGVVWPLTKYKPDESKSYILKLGVSLIRKWFMDEDKCIITKPGGLKTLLEFSMYCSKLDHPSLTLSFSLDEYLLPMVTELIKTETEASLNSGGLTALHYAVLLKLPEVLHILLMHPSIDINAQTDEGKTPFYMLLETFEPLKRQLPEMQAMAGEFLDDPKINFSICTKSGSTLIDCFEKLVENYMITSHGYYSVTAADYSFARARISWPLGSRNETPYCKKSKYFLAIFKLIQKLAMKVNANLKMKIAWLLLKIWKVQMKVQTNFITDNEACVSAYEKTFTLVLVGICTKGMKAMDEESKSIPFVHILAITGNMPLLCILLAQTDFDPMITDDYGNTVMHALFSRSWPSEQSITHVTNTDVQHLDVEMISKLLKHPDMNVLVQNDQGYTALDLVIKSSFPKSKVIDFVLLIAGHPTVSADMLHKAIVYLILQTSSHDKNEGKSIWDKISKEKTAEAYLDFYGESPPPSCDTFPNRAPKRNSSPLNDKINMIEGLFKHPSFQINQKTHRMGYTIGHIAAKTGDLALMDHIVSIPGYDPDVQDCNGNTALFYLFEYQPIQNVVSLLEKCRWNFTHTNKVGETVLDYCKNVETFDKQERLLFLCKKWMPETPKPTACSSEPTHTPAEKQPRPVSLILLKSDARQASVVTASEQTKVSKLYNGKHKVYNMKKARKGKACIISNHTFDVQWLKRLEGYTYDKDQLKLLWDHMGFEVYYPACEDSDSVLTAQEMESAVAKFAQELTEEDDCAILCILSHGGEGFVYGSDGKQVKIADLLMYLDNHHCLAMVGKPKVIIIQACNGDKLDTGMCETAAPCLAEPAANVDTNPFLSDMIICSPSMPGYVSYVYSTPGEGSVFIQTLVETLQEYAGTEDITSLHTRINDKIADTTIPVKKTDGSIGVYKQMSRFESTLRRRLYFLPCPGGKQGKDWN